MRRGLGGFRCARFHANHAGLLADSSLHHDSKLLCIDLDFLASSGRMELLLCAAAPRSITIQLWHALLNPSSAAGGWPGLQRIDGGPCCRPWRRHDERCRRTNESLFFRRKKETWSHSGTGPRGGDGLDVAGTTQSDASGGSCGVCASEY